MNDQVSDGQIDNTLPYPVLYAYDGRDVRWLHPRISTLKA